MPSPVYLLGVTAEVSWVPKPAHALTIRTPLYAVRIECAASSDG
jgi:hypothetical protein